ncbi:MAG: hypothetical protein N2V71_01615 [Methanophagales archaeon]|nr:hypothetical protein [Methanophagales archaeon]
MMKRAADVRIRGNVQMAGIPDVHQEYCRFVQRERIYRESGRRKRQGGLLKVKRM